MEANGMIVQCERKERACVCVCVCACARNFDYAANGLLTMKVLYWHFQALHTHQYINGKVKCLRCEYFPITLTGINSISRTRGVDEDEPF